MSQSALNIDYTGFFPDASSLFIFFQLWVIFSQGDGTYQYEISVNLIRYIAQADWANFSILWEEKKSKSQEWEGVKTIVQVCKMFWEKK